MGALHVAQSGLPAPAAIGVLPVPPFQELGIVLAVGCEVDCAAEHVEHAAVDRASRPFAELVEEPLRILVPKIWHSVDVERAQILRDAGANARNGQQSLGISQ